MYRFVGVTLLLCKRADGVAGDSLAGESLTSSSSGEGVDVEPGRDSRAAGTDDDVNDAERGEMVGGSLNRGFASMSCGRVGVGVLSVID